MFTIWCMSLNRNGREFLGIWRGVREFTELWRGARLLWQKEVPEVSKPKLQKVYVTAASGADLALLDFVLWAIGKGYVGQVTAVIGGEVHSFGGEAPLLSVRSVVEGNDGREAMLALGEDSELFLDSLHAGDAISVNLVLEPSRDIMEGFSAYPFDKVWYKEVLALPAVVEGGVVTVDALPCLLPDSRFVTLVYYMGFGQRDDWDTNHYTVSGTATITLNNMVVGTRGFSLGTSIIWCQEWTLGVPQNLLETVLADVNNRPLSLTVKDGRTDLFVSFAWEWKKIETSISLVVL